MSTLKTGCKNAKAHRNPVNPANWLPIWHSNPVNREKWLRILPASIFYSQNRT